MVCCSTFGILWFPISKFMIWGSIFGNEPKSSVCAVSVVVYFGVKWKQVDTKRRVSVVIHHIIYIYIYHYPFHNLH